jgi:hypothetical protein
MKTTHSKAWVAVCTSFLTAVASSRSLADQPAATASGSTDHLKDYTGTVASVDPKEHVLKVKGWMLNKAFNLGDNCSFQQLDKPAAAPGDLRIGEKVTVSYQDAHGVLIASKVEQKPMSFEGMVKAIDTGNHTITLHQTAMDKQVDLPADCRVMLRDGRIGTLADVRVGNHVTVTYETPAGISTAREVAQTSIPYTGTLTAIDVNDRTIKAKSGFSTKKFSLADDCAIVINGRTDGKMEELKPNDKLLFHYDEVNGVNVVNRIGPADIEPNSMVEGGPVMPPH